MKQNPYMVAHLIEGEARIFIDRLQREVAGRFGTRNLFDRIMPHITVKAPFCPVDIHDVDITLRRLAVELQRVPYSIGGVDRFRRSVVFVDVLHDDTLKQYIDRVVDELVLLDGVDRGEFEHEKRLHVTITSKKLEHVFDDLWEYMTSKHIPEFELCFDHIALLRHSGSRWEVMQKYPLK